MSGNLLVTAANLLRDITLAAAFGAALQSDIFFLAISIPVFIVTVTANAFRSVVVPALSRAQSLSQTQFQDMSSRFVLIATSATGLVGAALLVIAVGFYYVDLPVVSAANRRLFTLFLMAILPMYAGTALVELFQGPLQVTGRFLFPSLLKLGLPLGIIVAVLLYPETSIFNVAVGGGAGVLLVLPIGAYLLRREQMLPLSRTMPLPDDVRRTAVSGYQAFVAATLITYANPLVDQWMAGLAGSGAASMLGYSSRLMTGVVGLVAGAVSQVLLIQFSRQVGEGDRAGITATYRLLVRIMPWAGCFVTLGIWLTSDFLVSLLYLRGKFSASDAGIVADLVNRYALQFPVYLTGIAPGTLVWALSMNRILVRIGVVLFVANVLGDWAFLELFGVRGIPFSTTVVLIISGVMLNLALYKAGKLHIPLADWARALLPLLILFLCGMLISRFHIALSGALEFRDIVGALLLLAAFGGAAGAISLKEFRKFQSIA